MLPKARLLFSAFLLLTLCIAAGSAAAAATATPLTKATGILDAVWGDAPDGEHHLRWFLTDDRGLRTELRIDDLPRFGIDRWNHRRVRVTYESAAVDQGTPPLVRLVEVLPSQPEAIRSDGRSPISGSKPWVSILCKFADISAEPENLAFFQGMYANVPGGLDHYWREVSYDAIDIVGSTAVAWVTLPRVRTQYVPTPGSGNNANLGLLFSDCTAAADSLVDFSNGGSPFEGINLMFNATLDCCAWGGSRFATLDGVSKSWRSTWNPPWAFAQEAVIAHEMGHGFGLPHSNNSDGDSDPYDSPWDVMSAATSYTVNDSTYGRLGKHINSYHKNRLDWIPANRIFTVANDGSFTVTVDNLARASTSNYRMIRIPLGGATEYTVETRDQTGNYDGNVPGRAVIIHHVDPSRAADAEVIDADVPPATFSDNEGSMWKVGETYVDTANEISIRIDSATANGFQVTVTRGDAPSIFEDGFESGNVSAWTTSVE
ncbi:MAG: hypothetical protein AAF481_07500 [Acidobacteriota bacterium]